MKMLGRECISCVLTLALFAVAATAGGYFAWFIVTAFIADWKNLVPLSAMMLIGFSGAAWLSSWFDRNL